MKKALKTVGLIYSPYGRQWKYPKIYHMRSIFMSRKKFSKEFKLKLLKEHDSANNKCYITARTKEGEQKEMIKIPPTGV